LIDLIAHTIIKSAEFAHFSTVKSSVNKREYLIEAVETYGAKAQTYPAANLLSDSVSRFYAILDTNLSI